LQYYDFSNGVAGGIAVHGTANGQNGTPTSNGANGGIICVVTCL